MSNVTHLVRLPEKSESIADELGLSLYAGRIDPSDPEACFNFLYIHFPDRWREVMANLDSAISAAGQLYIAGATSRAS